MKKFTSDHEQTSIPSQTETKFRQEFRVGNGRKFSQDELVLLQILYRRITADFTQAPTANVEAKITTTCTIEKQRIGSKRFHDDFGEGRSRARTLTLEYTIKYESKYYNMKHYPRIFQNWMINNFDVVQTRMQILGINVDQVNAPTSRQLLEKGDSDRTHVSDFHLNDEDDSESCSSASSLPSPVALAKLTIGGRIDRRKRQLKLTNDTHETNAVKRTTSLCGRNGNMKPERRSPISKKILLQDMRG